MAHTTLEPIRRRSSTASHRSRTGPINADMDALSESAVDDSDSALSAFTDGSGSVSGPDRRSGRRSRRLANVYDAVAGRIRSSHYVSANKDRASRFRDAVLAPEEILFRSAGAPPRFEEDDIYFVHEDTLRQIQGPDESPEEALPDSDMLTAMHAYAGRYYEAQALQQARAHAWQAIRQAERRRQRRQSKRASGHSKGQHTENDTSKKDYAHNFAAAVSQWRHQTVGQDDATMDESALIAFGVLMEEAGREILGASGDMVFTELQELTDKEAREYRQQRQTETKAKGSTEETEKTKKTKKTEARAKPKKTGNTQGQAAGPQPIRQEDAVGGGGNEGDDEGEEGEEGEDTRPRKRLMHGRAGKGEIPSLGRGDRER